MKTNLWRNNNIEWTSTTERNTLLLLLCRFQLYRSHLIMPRNLRLRVDNISKSSNFVIFVLERKIWNTYMRTTYNLIYWSVRYKQVSGISRFHTVSEWPLKFEIEFPWLFHDFLQNFHDWCTTCLASLPYKKEEYFLSKQVDLLIQIRILNRLCISHIKFERRENTWKFRAF